MKKTLMLALMFLAIVMMAKVVQAGNAKTWKSPNGKDFITIGYYQYSHDLDITNLVVRINNKDTIFDEALPADDKVLPTKVVWSKKSDFAVIYFFVEMGRASLLVYDVKTKKVTKLFPLYRNGEKVCDVRPCFLTDLSKIKKSNGFCLGETPDMAFYNPSIIITPSGEIRYAVDYSNDPMDRTPEARDIPDVCGKGRVPINVITIEDVVQKKTGEVVKSKIYYSEDSFQP